MVTIEGAFLDVAFDDSQGNTNSNGDQYTFTITTPGGQQSIVNETEVDSVRFTLVGNCELADFLDAMHRFRKLLT